MAGKSAVLHGLSHDGTPFQFNDDYPAVEYYGQLLKAGEKSQDQKICSILII
jgi:hypothetical protein